MVIGMEKKEKESITFEEMIIEALVKEYEHQFGMECTYREISEDKRRA